MFDNISWAQYAAILLGATSLYYALLLAWFHHRRIGDFFRRFPRKNAFPPFFSEKDSSSDDTPEVMGRIRPAVGMSYSPSDQIRFSPEAEREEFSPLLSQIPEVLQELRALCEILETERGGIEDLTLLIGVVKSKYPDLTRSPFLKTLQENLLEQLPFELTPEEMEAVWSA